MRMSGTKPLKNTMRKSPIKQEVATKTSVTSTNNNRAGTSIRGKKTSSYVAMDKKAEVKNSKPKSAETIVKNEASKKAMDKYIKITKSKQALKEVTTKTPVGKPASKPVEGKPNASVKPTGKKAIDTVKKVAATATKGAVKSALMQLKKHKR